ncbi:MAG: serine/threonine-protein kinase [Phycisphaerae bacterium]
MDRRELTLELRRELIDAARLQFESAGMCRSDPGAMEAGGRIASAGAPTLPGYEILGVIHRGGQGTVYEARQRSTEQIVAIKVMRGDLRSPEQVRERARFDREVYVLGQLDHPSIVRVIDSGCADGNLYFIMNRVRGEPLDRYARSLDSIGDQKAVLVARLQLFARVCDAVQAAHLRGVIHRDLKPNNILVDASGEPRVLDFGLAKLGEAESADADAATTTEGHFVGSLPWASPEQAAGKSDRIDLRTDVYSLGVNLYQMLTGQFPYAVAGGMRHVLERIISSVPLRPSVYARHIDEDLETIILRCLAKEPERRYQTAGELACDVRRYLADEPIAARRDGAWYIARKMVSRYRARLVVLAAFMFLAVGASVVTTVLYRQQAMLLSERDEAAKRATSAAAQVQAALDRSLRVSQFAQEVLSGIDPAVAGALDKKLLRLVLDKAAQRAATELAGQPEAEAEIRGTIGRAYHAIGEWALAETHLVRALGLRRALGTEPGRTLSCAMNLGILHMDQGRFVEAEPLLQEALQSSRLVLGARHPTTLKAIDTLGQLYRQEGRIQSAEALYREALELRKAVLGADHPDTLTSMNNLGTLLCGRGQYADAEALLRQAFERERVARGESHPHTLSVLANLARVVHRSGRFDEGESLQRHAIAGFVANAGEDYPRTLQLQCNLAAMYRASGKLDEAAELFRTTLERQRRVLGECHPQISETLHNMADLAAQRNDPALSAALFSEALGIGEASLPHGNVRVASMRIGLGSALMKLGRFTDAEPQLLVGYGELAGNCDATPDLVKLAAELIRELYATRDYVDADLR